MSTMLKPGDRVRLKNSVSFGTVVEVVGGGAGGSAGGGPPVVMVEWDGHDGVRDGVRAADLTYVRPPPRSGSRYGGLLPSGGW